MDSAYQDTYSALLLIMKNVAGHLPESDRAEVEIPLINAARSIPRLVSSERVEDMEKAAKYCNEAIAALSYCRDVHSQRINKNVCDHIIEIYKRSLPPVCGPEATSPAQDDGAVEKRNSMGKVILLLLAFGAFLLTSCQPSTHHAKVAKSNTLSSPPVGEGRGEGARLSPVHFPTGKDVLSGDESGVLDSNVLWLEKNPQAVLVLEGHCDERGGDSFNMELGDRRARRIKSKLIEKGIESDRLIMVVSYGERQPADPRHTPDAWNKNRRVEFIVR